MRTRRARVSALVLALAFAGCGGEERLDRDDYRSVFDAAMAAVAAQDLDALWPLLTEDGRTRVERNLRDWQARLRDPEQGPRIVDLIRERRGGVTKTEIELAAGGSLRHAWEFFLAADPRPVRPPQKGIQVAQDGRTVTILYEDPYRNHRPVRLVRMRGGWYVDDLQL